MLPKLAEWGVQGLVVAPTMLWPDAPNTPVAEMREFRKKVEGHGLVVAGLQSLVFGRSDVSLFGEEADRVRLTEHLERQADVAGALGATSLIFGSPGLRKRGDLTTSQAHTRAIGVFRPAANAAADNGAKLCIEPLAGYGNEFVETTEDGIVLVEYVNRTGFGLHLDSAAITGAGEEPWLTIPRAHEAVGIQSFDASAPDLGMLTGDQTVEHWKMSNGLWAAGYDGFVSIEMRGPLDDPKVEEQIRFAQSEYGTAAAGAL